MKSSLFLITFILSVVCKCEGYKFLLIYPYPTRSLNILGEGTLRHLLEAGHEVTYITVFPLKNRNEKALHQIDVSNNLKLFEGWNISLATVFDNNIPQKDLHLLRKFALDSATATFKNEAVKTFLADKTQKFDAVIADFYDIDIFAGFYTLPEEEELYRNVFEPLLNERGKSIPPYDELIHNASLVLANDHTAAGNVPKVPANFKFVGGQHIHSPSKPLPKDLQTLMDNARNGVIYFSLGSTFKSKDLPKVILDDLLKVFGTLKETVIWKFEEDLQNLPANVHILKWAPQQSILDHPKCLLFISHGGILSSMEAVHFGVPIIGVPIYLDQFINIKKAVNHGYALQVELNYSLAEQIKNAINKMLVDKTYAENAKRLSLIYHDRPVPPGAELVHWVEHAVRTRGAPHLRSPALRVPFYQKLYLDLAALVIAIIFILRTIVCRLFCSKKQTSQKMKTT